MNEDFIKLKLYKREDFVYVRPKDIAHLIWYTGAQYSHLVCAHGLATFDLDVEETPGEIFEACRKALTKQETE